MIRVPAPALFARKAAGVWNEALPDLAGWRVRHRLTRLATESVLELGHVRHHAVDARGAGRVRVGDGVDTEVFGTLVLAGPLRHADKEALVWREAVGVRQLLALGLLLPCDVGEQGSAQVGHILAAGQLGVDMDVVD